ncbi:hypothetical protein KQX54_017422 [Cotesia glomerata]|uniref:Transposase n=1 Tax=Cotesia glomerata TaxID=32391 RepID=A0AAV7IAE1_COTGL|nr:hypothetical protein KQX54_017422 [Cotesia glomerata]
MALRKQKNKETALKPRYKKKCTEVTALKKLSLMTAGKSLTSVQKVFIEMQFQQSGKSLKRWNSQKVCDKINFDTGISSVITRYLQAEDKRLSSSLDKYVTVIWDEAATAPNLDYDAQNDKIAGFEDYGYKRMIKFADHVLVVAIHSANCSQSIPIYHDFCEGQTSPADLTRIVKLVLDKVIESGLIPVATICDQGTNNVRTIKNMLVQSNTSRFKQKLNSEFSPRHFNQDHLESTFGWLRQRSCNKKPSCKLITRHLRSFLIDKVGRFQIRHGNTESTSVGDAREIDFGDVISTFNNFLLDVNSADSDDEQDACTEDSFTESSVKINAHVSINDSKSPNIILHLSRNEEIMQTLLKIVVGCGDCTESLVRSQGGQSADSSFDKMYTLALSVLNERIVSCCYQKKLSENLKALLQEQFDNGKIDQFWLKCTKHYKEVHARVIGIIIRRFIDGWCAAVNNHLSGKTDNLKKANSFFIKPGKNIKEIKRFPSEIPMKIKY